jgi:DNA gyrase subunit B
MQVTIEDAVQADSIITVLMGDKVEPRREYIIEHAEFNKEDRFEGNKEEADK